MSLLFNMLSRLVIAFLTRSKHLLISWLKSPSAVIWNPQNKFSHCFHFFSIYLHWSDGTRCPIRRERVKRKHGFCHNREEATTPQELDSHMPAWPLFPSRVGRGRGEHHQWGEVASRKQMQRCKEGDEAPVEDEEHIPRGLLISSSTKWII